MPNSKVNQAAYPPYQPYDTQPTLNYTLYERIRIAIYKFAFSLPLALVEV